MMSRKHYEAIAKVIRTRRVWSQNAFYPQPIETATIDAIAHDLAETFKGDNPRFQNARFLKACGTTP